MRCSDRVKQAPMALIAPTALTLVSGLSLLLPATPGWAQDWPQPRAVRIVVPFTPGSATDVVSRAVFEQVSRQIGQPVVVENRAGGGTTIGSALVAKAEPDGHTLLVNSTSQVVVAAAFKNLSYSVADDFTSVAGLITQPFAVATRTRYKSIAELVQYGRANPGKLNYGTNGPGTSGHLFMEKFALAAKIKMTQIPFRGTPEAMTEVMADRLDMFPGPVLTMMLMVLPV
jgi:tripartite-type tricarboxylate transporter receptor subunit TctC